MNGSAGAGVVRKIALVCAGAPDHFAHLRTKSKSNADRTDAN